MSSNTENNDGNALNQWDLPEGPSGAFENSQWKVKDAGFGEEKLRCENRYSGYRITVDEKYPGTHRIELIHFDNPHDVPCVPKEQWKAETPVETEDITGTLYRLCQEYSTQRPSYRSQVVR